MGDDGLSIIQKGGSSFVEVTDETELHSNGYITEKDPRKIARNYQLELCKKALEENVIVYLETGCGKTHIAVLLMYEMGYLIKKPQKNICVFLAPTVALVHQQARVISESTDFKVGLYCGEVKLQRRHDDWYKEVEQYEVLVMTPQMLLHSLSHCFIKMEMIVLLIFDECHYAQLESNHPYAEIMKVFYNSKVGKLPRIFGMTASPIFGKGASLDGLKTLLHAKICTVEDKEELEKYVSTPVVKAYPYGSNTKGSPNSYQMYLEGLEEIKRQCISVLGRNSDDHNNTLRIKKLLQRLHYSMIFCLQSLGLCGALQASRFLLNGDQSERNELIEATENASDDNLCNEYLFRAAALFDSFCIRDGSISDLSHTIVLKEPLFSQKVLCLIGILSTFRPRPNMKCIIFVNRIVVARSLSYMIQQLKILASWRCDFLVGVHSGLKSMSRKTTNNVVEQFRSGKLNLLIATKVGEEGLDIQTCCLVIRFDLPETVASFIQSRGRARMPQSEYALLVDSDNEKELNLIDSFKKDELQMNIDIISRTSGGMAVDFEEKIYSVDSTGATISSQSSISLLHHYCSKLPHDEYFNPKPDFFYLDGVDGTECHIILPSNAPIHKIASTPQSSMEAAKKDACLKACKELHQMGVLTDYLLLDQYTETDESLVEVSDSDSSDDESSRGELQEMLVPSALKEPWNELEKPIRLNSYFIRFTPKPSDRQYKEFGIFIKAPLPHEAERMKVDLHLTHGRYVVTEFIPSGDTEFDEDEILLAQNFQEMFLKIIFNRSEFVPSFVPLEKSAVSNSEPSTFYLLLPVIWNQYKSTMTIDWKIIRRCLSSQIFGTSADIAGSRFPQNECLQLFDGPTQLNDIVNSLVYAEHKRSFFFVCQILHSKNSYSYHSDSASHVEHLRNAFHIDLRFPDQPLLQAKQLFYVRNLLHDRRGENSEPRVLEEHFFELPPELCSLKILGFSKDIGSSISLLPSIMHRLENLLVAIELRTKLSGSFPEGAEVTAEHVLEALTTEKCNERFSLERLEVLGDAFLKFAVGRHLFLSYEAIDEGQLTRKRSKLVNNSNLCKLATMNGIQVYIRDQEFDPCQFFALGRSCHIICTDEKEKSMHPRHGIGSSDSRNAREVRCNKHHHWLHRKTIADVVEALIGAYIVDSGFKAAIAFLRWIGICVDFEVSQLDRVCIASESFMSVAASLDIPALEGSLGYHFLHRGLLIQAFIHPSYNRHGGGCYQRLEFLGDAVLDYLITSYIYSLYPKLKPGQLTDLRSVLVNNGSFAQVAVSRTFHKFIINDSPVLCDAIERYVNYVQTPDSERNLHEEPPCPKALGDLVESCIGAIALDTGFNLTTVWEVMLSFLAPAMSFSSLQVNPIRELTELCQSYNWIPEFSSLKKNKHFVVEVKVDLKTSCSTASATNRSKKVAKGMAAQQVVAELKARGYRPKSKSLEDILKTSRRMEAKLIGFDETPLSSTSSAVVKFKGLGLDDTGSGNADPMPLPLEQHPMNTYHPRIKAVKKIATSSDAARQQQPSEPAVGERCSRDSETGGGSQKTSAKSRLHEICAANCWKPPLFECCNEEGPSHLRLFTYKVVVHIEEDNLELECVGEPHSRKKVAAEQAAAGALWLLEKEGYIPGL